MGMDAVIILVALLFADPGEAAHSTFADNPAAAASRTSEPIARDLPKENVPIGRVTSPEKTDALRRTSPVEVGWGSFWRGMGSLVIVLGIIGGLAYVVRRWSPRGRGLAGGPLEVVGRTYLSTKQSVALVRVGERLVMIGVGPDSISQLLVIDEPVEVAALTARGRSGLSPDRELPFDRLMDASAAEFERATNQDEASADDAPEETTVFSRTRVGLNRLLSDVRARAGRI